MGLAEIVSAHFFRLLARTITALRVLVLMFLGRPVGLVVVFVVVDLPARFVLLAIHVSPLLGRQLAAVRRAIVADFSIDVSLAIFNISGLARSQFTGLHAVPDALLLPGFPRVDVAHRGRAWSAVIFRSEVRPVGAGVVLVRGLLPRRLKVLLPPVRLLSGAFPRTDSAGSAVEAGAVHRRVAHDHSLVDVRVVNHCGVYARHRRVIGKVFASPLAAAEADAAVSVAIVHAAIEADVRAPVAGMEDVHAFIPSPITRRPNVAFTRTKRLLVHRQSRRANPDRNTHGNQCE